MCYNRTLNLFVNTISNIKCDYGNSSEAFGKNNAGPIMLSIYINSIEIQFFIEDNISVQVFNEGDLLTQQK